MADEPAFHLALKDAIENKTALCVYSENGELAGGVVVSKEANEILWLAVTQKSRGKGIGRALISQAIRELDASKEITVQTFDSTVPEGAAARALYQQFGFEDIKNGGDNPAGIRTVIMRRPAG